MSRNDDPPMAPPPSTGGGHAALAAARAAAVRTIVATRTRPVVNPGSCAECSHSYCGAVKCFDQNHDDESCDCAGCGDQDLQIRRRRYCCRCSKSRDTQEAPRVVFKGFVARPPPDIPQSQ